MLKVECLHAMEAAGKAPEEERVVSCVGVNPESQSHDQLYVSRSEVIWYEGLNLDSRTVRKVYRTETPVLQVFWCNFLEEGRMGAGGGKRGCGSVCIMEHSCLGVYMATGAVHYVPFPFPVRKVWPLDYGLLVERLLTPESGYDGLPTLFSVLHPMDDFCPVTCRRPSNTSARVQVLGFFGESGLQVRDVCCLQSGGVKSMALVVTYNTISMQHIVWSVQTASREDIPSHFTTPQKSRSNLTTPSKLLSTSAPSCYGNEATPSGLMVTPVEMIMSCNRLQDNLRNTVLTQQGGGEGGGRSGHKMGRSPFISRLHNPVIEAANFFKRFSKSMSPPTLARMSPFSQTIDSRTWTTFYSEEMSFGSNYEPLVPQICLHSLWTGPSCTKAGDGATTPTKHATITTMIGTVTSILHTCDLMGCHFVGLLVSTSHQLYMLSCDGVMEEGKKPSLGTVTAILPGNQAISLPELSMMVVLEMQQKKLIVYSGIVKMGVVDLCTLPLAMPCAPIGVMDPVGDTFSLMVDTPACHVFRCCLHPLSRHPTVEMCLMSLCNLLPHDIGWKFLSSFYLTSSHLPLSKLLPHFIMWMLGSLEGGAKAEREEEVSCASERAPFPVLSQILCPQAHRPTVALAIHLVYEELKLDVLHVGELSELAELLVHIARLLGWQAYADHYQRDFPHLFLLPPSSSLSSSLAATLELAETIEEEGEEDMSIEGSSPIFVPESPPHIFQWLLFKLQGMQPPPFPVLTHVTRRTALLIKLYSILMCDEEEYLDPRTVVSPLGESPPNLCWDKYTRCDLLPQQRVVMCCIDEDHVGLSMPDLDTLPVGVALPVLDCIRRCHEDPPPCWSAAAYNLIGRTDIARTLDSAADVTTPPLKMRGDGGGDGMNLDLEVLRICFPNDLRVNEVRRMLQSALPVRVNIVQKPEVGDHDFIQLQEVHLLCICQRTMALSVGRGMFTLSTVHPLPTSPLSSIIPPLTLSGRAVGRSMTVGLEHVEKPLDMSMWPEFHNGVAAGLCLAHSSSKLDSAWIVFNRPNDDELVNTYAGFLMALGLTGHLDSLQDYHLYGYLQDKHPLTVVALLFGITASNRGKMSPSLLGLLAIFFPPLLPPGAADMEISHTMQTAALLGIGLLYEGSANRHMIQVVLGEIGHTPGPELEFAENRESYSLAAGLALGLITLAGGRSLEGLDDLNLLDQLLLLINGGWKRESSAKEEAGGSHLVLEGEMVNTHVTAPGAIMALGLMFLKTNDRTVAALLDPPDTLYNLDCVRPDFLLLRAVSRGLIMWDEVEPSQDWIKQQLPSIVREWNGDKSGSQSGVDTQTLSQARAYIMAGSCFAIGLRFSGSRDERARQCLLQVTKEFVKALKNHTEEAAGKHCLEQCLCTTLLALAMPMSGSGDLHVMRVIRQLHVCVGELTYGSHMAVHMALGLLFLGGGRYSLSSSNIAVASLVCSLFPVFPSDSLDNRYHLQALRHLYVLAARPGVLVARNRETGQSCPVEVSVRTEGQVIRTMTPCLLQDWEKIESVEVLDEGYWPLTVGSIPDRNNPLRKVVSKSGVIFVQAWSSGRKAKVRSEQFGSIRGKVTVKSVSASSLSSHLFLQSCPGHRFVTAALMESAQQEKLNLAFSHYLQLEQSIHAVTRFTSDLCLPHHLWQLKLARAYISLYSLSSDASVPSWNGCGQSLLSREFVGTLGLRMWHFLWMKEEDYILGPLKSYLKLHPLGVWSHSAKAVCLLARLLVWYDIPYLQLSPQAMLPDVFLQLRALTGPSAATAAVKLLPLFPGNSLNMLTDKNL